MGGEQELSEIIGIGPARARWLKETFGVRGFRDLAGLSPEDIERKLKAEGRERVSRKTIESWVAQARVRASEEKGKPSVAASAKDSRGRAGREPSEWKPVTSFVVEFQSRRGEGDEQAWRTSVHYMERDLSETWAGIDCGALCRWMTEQLRDAGGPALEVAPLVADESRPPGPTADAVAEEAEGDIAAAPEQPSVALRAHVVDGDGVERANLIRIDKPWAVVFSWSLEEGVTSEKGDEWLIDVLLKLVGPGEPLRLREEPLSLPATRPRINGGYRYRFEVAIGIVTSAHVEALYRGSATIMYRSKAEDRVLIAGVADLGLLRFYQPFEAAGRPTPPLAGVQAP